MLWRCNTERGHRLASDHAACAGRSEVPADRWDQAPGFYRAGKGAHLTAMLRPGCSPSRQRYPPRSPATRFMLLQTDRLMIEPDRDWLAGDVGHAATSCQIEIVNHCEKCLAAGPSWHCGDMEDAAEKTDVDHRSGAVFVRQSDSSGVS